MVEIQIYSIFRHIAIIGCIFVVSISRQSQALDLPTQNTVGSKYTINYDDWGFVLENSVLYTGRSDRRPPSRAAYKNSATRIKHGNTSVSALEGNRVLYHEFGEQHRSLLLSIRKDLEALPDSVALEKFSKNEQLAYWLNLHNIAVMLEVSQNYPIRNLRALSQGKKNAWAAKTMKIGNTPTSIQDIENHIVENWKDPLVLYGLYMGAIGGPNIRTEAFTGGLINQQLEENATEFVNSLRGVRFWNNGARISAHYFDLGKTFFPDFKNDIKRHLLKFSSGPIGAKLRNINSFKKARYDWSIADLKNGESYSGSSYNTNSGALVHFIDSDTSGTPALPALSFINMQKDRGVEYAGIPPHVAALLSGIQKRNAKRLKVGTVTVEEFVTIEGSRIRLK